MWVGFLQRGGPAAAAVSWETAGTPRGGAGPGGAAGRGRPRPRPRAGFQAAAAVAPGPGFKSPRQTGKRGAALGSPAAYFSRFPCISTLSNPRKNKQ